MKDTDQSEAKFSTIGDTRVSRRGFMILASEAALAVPVFLSSDSNKNQQTVSTVTQAPHQPTPEASSPLTGEALKTHVENTYGIIISEAPGYNFPWTTYILENSIKGIDKVLAQFPPSFYAPDGQGRKVNLELSSSPYEHCCGYEKDRITMGINTNIFLAPQTAARGLVHEFSELVTTVEAPDPTHNRTLYETPSDKDVEKILGGDFEHLKDIKKAQAQQLLAQYKGDNGKAVFLNSFTAGLGFATLSEFTSTMSENYIEGPNFFKQNYALLFPQETVDKLYDFTKTTIFRGKEYPKPLYTSQGAVINLPRG